jgi:hypothetical protein
VRIGRGVGHGEDEAGVTRGAAARVLASDCGPSWASWAGTFSGASCMTDGLGDGEGEGAAEAGDGPDAGLRVTTLAETADAAAG